MKVKEDANRPKYTSSFLICPNLNDSDSQTFKRSSRKKNFPSVYVIDATCFDECFLFHVITRLVFSRFFGNRGNLGNVKGSLSFLSFTGSRNPTILVYVVTGRRYFF